MQSLMNPVVDLDQHKRGITSGSVASSTNFRQLR
jgi:hypothetical protein